MRGRGSSVWDAEGNELPRRHRALWYCNVGYGRDEIAAAARGQLRELPASTRSACSRTSRSSRSPSASPPSRRCEDPAVFFTPAAAPTRSTPRQAGPPLLVGGRQATTSWCWSAGARLPRHERVRHEPRRHPRKRAGLRRARSAKSSTCLGLRRRARQRYEGSRPTTSRRSSASPSIGAGGMIPPPEGYWPRSPRSAARRRPAHLGRGDLRLRAARPLVRRRALRHPARPP